jgi:bla regulator protein BlaR1
VNVNHLAIVSMEFFKWILSTSAIAALLVGLIFLTKLALRSHLKPRWHYIIWLLLPLRLLLPWIPESSFSIFNLFANHKSSNLQTINYETTASIAPAKIITEVTSVPYQVQNDLLPLILKCAFWVWLLVVVFLSVYTLLINRRFAKSLQKMSFIRDANILQVFENCKQDMSIHSSIRLMSSNLVASPTLFGFMKPYLIIPEGTLTTLSLEQLRYIIIHELAHHKRKDIAINWLMQILLILHWFNPILWYANRRMREDQEMACDALALTQMDSNESKEYGRTIITLLESFAEQKQIPGMASFSGNKTQLKRRISMINLFKQNSYHWSILGVAVIIALGGLFLTSGKTSEAASEPQLVLEAYLDSLIAGEADKAFSYITYTGVSEAVMRQEFEDGAIKGDKLLAYKIIKFFMDDETHASAAITITTLNEGEYRSVNELIKINGVWKIPRFAISTISSADHIIKDDLNSIDNRPNKAQIYESEQNVNNGEVEQAQPSTGPTQP